MIPFSCLWFAFAVFWEFSVLNSGHAPLLARLWGIPFVLVGLYFTVGRFVFDAYRRGNTTYALSDRAAYIVIDGLGSRTLIYTSHSISPIEFSQEEADRGTIHFGPRHVGRSRNPWTPDASQFVGIPDATKVYALAKNIATR